MNPAESAQWAELAMMGVGNIFVAHFLVRILKLDARAVYSSIHAGLSSYALVLLAIWCGARYPFAPLLVLLAYIPVMGWVYQRAYRIDCNGANTAAGCSFAGAIAVVLVAGLFFNGAPR